MLSTNWAGTVSGSVARTYDNDFRITSRSVNGGHVVSFQYDDDSLLTGAGSEALTYDATNGLLTGSALGVVSDSYGYNGFAEVASYNADANASLVFNTVFTRDKLGRITKKVETVQGVAHTFDYFYDASGRLIAVNRDGISSEVFTYDQNGNRTNNAAVYDDQDRLTSLGAISYTYTANGELLTKINGADTTSYSYDVLGNLMSVTLPAGNVIEYIVDGSNRRIGKKVDGTLEQGFLYKDQLNPIAELDGLGNVVSRFVYSSRANVPDFMIKGGSTYRIISDHLGSPRLVVDITTGLPAQVLEYDSFGNIITDTNPGFQPFGFAGGLYDSSTKLTRFGTRDYDAETGRWTSKDPIRFNGGDTNLYGYTLNDPVNFVDTDGLLPLARETAEGLVFGAKVVFSALGFGTSVAGDKVPGRDSETFGTAVDALQLVAGLQTAGIGLGIVASTGGATVVGPIFLAVAGGAEIGFAINNLTERALGQALGSLIFDVVNCP